MILKDIGMSSLFSALIVTSEEATLVTRNTEQLTAFHLQAELLCCNFDRMGYGVIGFSLHQEWRTHLPLCAFPVAQPVVL